ncbi:hypothetical protein VNO78_09793 [Psophocarpus tetragonolobus]|uniref:Uncharacterized protein n=1 Tax=Psophocarpus tetragonolobus TaxID=3891 RepID=A0AAN9SXH8_PSOTE
MLLEPPPRLHLKAIFHTEGDDSTEQHHQSSATWHKNNALSPCMHSSSPLHNQLLMLSPLTKSPWHNNNNNISLLQNGLVGSIKREEGHVCSLAVSGDLLYTGSQSKNIRVWKNLKDHTGFKSSSGFVKSIVLSITYQKIFTGHQDGKIRIWKLPNHKRVGTLPGFKDYVKRKVRHYDAVSSLSLDEENGLLYSASWDKTVRVWSASDMRFLEAIEAHADAVNAVVTGFEGRVFTGSADGTVKVWKREKGRVRHALEGVLLKGESAVTALAVSLRCGVVYGGCSDGVVRFWEWKRGVWKGGVLRGCEGAVLCVCVVGRYVVSGYGDGSVGVWKREASGVHAWVCALLGHTGPVKCVAAVEDGFGKCVVYTGSVDGSVKVWRVGHDAPVLRVC